MQLIEQLFHNCANIRYTICTVKNLIRIGMVFFALLAFASFYASLSLLTKSLAAEKNVPDAGRRYHFSLYLPETKTSFFSSIVEGAEKAAAEVDAALSIHSINPVKKELALASYTGADGLIVCPYLDDRLARHQLEKIQDNDIPLITINHYVSTDQPWPFIGPNNFDVGKKMGQIARELSGLVPQMAIIYSDKSPGMLAERDLLELGLASIFPTRPSSPIPTFKTGQNPLDAEDLLYRLFKASPHIDTLIFTDASDSITAAQVIIDLNLVGRIHLIGFGEDAAILEFLRKGIIAGSIAINPEKIGYQAVYSLLSLIKYGYTSTSVDTGVRIIQGAGL